MMTYYKIAEICTLGLTVDKTDNNGVDLFTEIKILKLFCFKTQLNHTLLYSIYSKIPKHLYCFQNVAFTLPVSVASEERSFFKLKIIKNCNILRQIKGLTGASTHSMVREIQFFSTRFMYLLLFMLTTKCNLRGG